MNKGRMPRLAYGPFLMLALLAGCADRTKPSAEENRQLENAGEMLDEAPQTLGNIDENALANSDGNSTLPPQ